MDRDLVEQARRGDREAFAVLVHQVSDSLYAVAQRILRDTGLAEDALQNALVLAWRRTPAPAGPRPLRGVDPSDPRPRLLRRIAAGSPLDGERPGPAHRWAVDAGRQRRLADRDELERAFRRLPIEQRAVFVLHHYLGLPLVEIAELLEIPAGTARSRLHYAIARAPRRPDGRAGARCPQEGRLA